MVQFHETVMGKRFYENTLPSLVDEINRLRGASEQVGSTLAEEFHRLNENLNPDNFEREIADSGNIVRYLADGWRPVLTFCDGVSKEEFIIVERRKK